MTKISIACLMLLIAPARVWTSEADDPVRTLLSANPSERQIAAKAILASGDKRYLPSLLEIAFFHTYRKDAESYGEVNEILQKLSGEKSIRRYFGWLQWIGAHPEIKPLPRYLALKREIFGKIDPAFAKFLGDEKSLRIRAEEIVWGGVLKDGIPALIRPPNIPAEQATYLKDTDRVFGVSLGDETRAYPLRIMDWHEMANDVVGGIPVSLSYCTLCGSAILYHGKANHQSFTFGSSGLLYRSNKLMYDHSTESLWSELQGIPVAGKLVDQGIHLEVLPIVLTTWDDWKRRHPRTTVLSLNTGYQRNYNVGPYEKYFESKDLMFPVPFLNEKLRPKDFVFVLRLGVRNKAYPLDLLLKKRFLKDRLAEHMVVLTGDPGSRSVRAYQCDTETVQSDWTSTEEFLISPDGTQRCSRLPGHLAYWFGWHAQFPTADLYED
jgi:hypothetical protein